MSASDEKISNTVVNEDDDDEDEDQNDVVSSIGKNQRTKPRFGVLQRQFSKAKSKFRRIKSKRVLLPSSSLSENANSNTGSAHAICMFTTECKSRFKLTVEVCKTLCL
ncbi:PREDICTED: uncharacterized protein LOC109332208 isoform X2 [Lupinus angustifolius]|uniref:uncharacterized protein LOC109332208 isoform X2 n=1 Tax=Lupinus angustifolius TaxID=3871 RepID=UPI00092ED02C|nr:PREDICTED: uncharacterized protein LOC109332208 isoform X2 [Lupinus angustifolius]